MLREITWQQFVEWSMYAEVEPFDELRMDYRFASIVQALYNINRDPKRHKQPFPITEFLLKFGAAEAKPAQTWQQQKAIAQALFKAWQPKKRR